MALPATAQTRPLVLRNCTVLTGDGRMIEDGEIRVENGRIVAVGEDVPTNLFTQRVNLHDAFVTPGLINTWTTAAMDYGREGAASYQAADAFDRYDRQAFESLLRYGVTTIYVPARSLQGIAGQGAVIRLGRERVPKEHVVLDDAALCINLGLDPRERGYGQARAFGTLRKAFADAIAYREALLDYEDALEEYETKLAEYVKKVEAGKGKEQPAETGKKQSQDGSNGKGDRPSGTGDQKQGKKPQKKKKDDAPQKPQKPPRDPDKELLLRVLDQELHVRVAVQDTADVLNALALAEEFNLSLILEGAQGAAPVADRIAAAEVPVIVTPPPDTMLFVAGAPGADSEPLIGALRDAGVEVYLATGPDSGGYQLAAWAAAAVSQGLPEDEALSLITSQAASLLHAEGVGRVAPGQHADLVVWSDHPLRPTARVKQVFIGGEKVYDAAEEEDNN